MGDTKFDFRNLLGGASAEASLPPGTRMLTEQENRASERVYYTLLAEGIRSGGGAHPVAIAAGVMVRLVEALQNRPLPSGSNARDAIRSFRSCIDFLEDQVAEAEASARRQEP